MNRTLTERNLQAEGSRRMKKFGKTGALLLSLVLLAVSCSPASGQDGAVLSARQPEKERVIVEAPKKTEPVITASPPPGIYTPEDRPSHITLSADPSYKIVYVTSTGAVPDRLSQTAGGEIRQLGIMITFSPK